MRRYLTLCAMLLTSCSAPAELIVQAPPIPADLLVTCPGWSGPVPQTQGQLIDAAHAEQTGRRCANGKLTAIAEIVTIGSGKP